MDERCSPLQDKTRHSETSPQTVRGNPFLYGYYGLPRSLRSLAMTWCLNAPHKRPPLTVWSHKTVLWRIFQCCTVSRPPLTRGLDFCGAKRLGERKIYHPHDLSPSQKLKFLTAPSSEGAFRRCLARTEYENPTYGCNHRWDQLFYEHLPDGWSFLSLIHVHSDTNGNTCFFVNIYRYGQI